MFVSPRKNAATLPGVSSESKNTEVVVPAPETPDSLWLRPALIASWWEIATVLILVQGHFIYGSTRDFLRRSSGTAVDLRLNDFRAMHLMGVESAILALFLVYLHWRGWTPNDLRIKMCRRGVSQGIILGAVNLIILTVGNSVAHHLRGVPQLLYVAYNPHLRPHITHLDWAALMASQVINAFFEEVTCICYAFNQFAARRGPLFALMLMLILRASYHTWKSPVYLIVTIIHFSLFGLWYWRTRNVWPLIVAHFAYDLIVISPQVR